MNNSPTSNITEIKRKTDVEDVLLDALKNKDQYIGLVILGVTNDHAPVLISSRLENYQLAYLLAFYQTVMSSKFEGVLKQL